MTDLAYQRTVGQPIDESVPKNQIPNSQFFEKVYQSDLNTKAQRKSMSPLAHIKQEQHKSPSSTDKLANSSAIGEMERPAQLETPSEQLNASRLHSQEAKLESTSLVQESVGQPVKPLPVLPPMETQSALPADTISHPRALNRGVTKRRQPKPLNKQKTKRKLKKAVLKSLEDAKLSLAKEVAGSNDLSAAVSGPMEVSPSKNSRLKFLQSMDITQGVFDGMPHVSSKQPKYINENGEVIKIVRMRQEEIINCLCSYFEEDGLMIQCELCLCWQHGICNGIEKESQVPEKYICYICRNPQRGRESMKYVHDQDWLYAGKLPVANYHSANSKHSERFDMLKQSHTLTGNLLELKRFMHSLKVKMNIAENKDHPKMYLWSKKWEKSPVRSELVGIEPLSQPEKTEPKFSTTDELNQLFSSPQTKTEDVKEALTSPLCASLQNIKSEAEKSETAPGPTKNADVAENKQNEFGDDKMLVDQSILAGLLTNANTANVEQRTPETVKIPQPEAAINPAECQLRLLDHIQKQQTLVMARMQTIEAQIIGLECRDEKTHALEPADSFVKTKQIINLLLNDLQKMRKIADINSMVVEV